MEKKNLNIAFLGCNTQRTHEGLRKFEKDNSEQIDNKDPRNLYPHCGNEVYLIDGTRISAISDEAKLYGCRFDQLILFDDERDDIFEKQKEKIKEITFLMGMSKIPEEFQILKYEDIK